MAAKDDLGRAGEATAARYLAEHGLTVLERNWRVAGGELDIVAATARELVVVEVKTRSSTTFGDPLDAVDTRKRARLWRLGCQWCREHPAEARGRRLRLDVIGIVGRDPARAPVTHVKDVSWP